MSKFLSALAKVGLIELESDDKTSVSPVDTAAIDALLADAGINKDAIPEVATTTLPAPPAPKGAIVEGRAFSEIYAAAGVAKSPLNADKLLKILNGLRMMDIATRKAAVMAMDAAEEAWTIEDALLDVQRKTRALNGAKTGIDAQLTRAETEAKSIRTDADALEATETTRIRGAIQALEAELETMRKTIVSAKATAQSEFETARELGFREKARFDTEIARLQEINSTFGSSADPTSTPTEM
jgi:hypothetical protein